MNQWKTIEITLQDGNLPFSVEIERYVTNTFNIKSAVYEFLDTFHPNAILISFKEIK